MKFSPNKLTIFNRILSSVLLPEIIVFSVIATISFKQVKTLFSEHKAQQIENFRGELQDLNEITNIHFATIEQSMNANLERLSMKIMEAFKDNYDRLGYCDLDSVRREMGMNSKFEDIYIIDNNGIIFNTTFYKDLGLSLYSFGEETKSRLIELRQLGEFVSDPFSIESNTKRIKKYSYQPTPNKEYLIELGFYSEEADLFHSKVSERIQDIVKNFATIQSIDFCIGKDYPISFYSSNDLDSLDKSVIKTIYATKRDTSFQKNDTLMYQYLVLDKADSDSQFSQRFVKIVYNQGPEIRFGRQQLKTDISIFGVGFSILLILLLYNSKKIADPLKELVNSAIKIGNGNLETSLDLSGTKETSQLSDQFNLMTAKLKESRVAILHQKALVEEKNKEILDSINYAKRIQTAILPTKTLVKEYLPESFILYQPKDIVAGDFYWLEKVGDEIIFAAADCTGHGVPGAMVSVVCHSALNRAVREFKLTKPALIIDKVRGLIIETFEKSDQDMKDGMDIAICTLNLKTNQLQYAGANNALHIIKQLDGNETPDSLKNETHYLQEIKSDKQPVGKHIDMTPFTNHTLMLKKGDCIFIFTDGYADQFGGLNGKKYKYKPLKKKLIDTVTKPLSEQKEILKSELEMWKGELDQVDDICVIGVKILDPLV